MLMNPEWSECHESKVELQELAECEKVFGSFLRYIYTGKILITHTNVMPVLALADKYIVKVSVTFHRFFSSFMCTLLKNFFPFLSPEFYSENIANQIYDFIKKLKVMFLKLPSSFFRFQ